MRSQKRHRGRDAYREERKERCRIWREGDRDRDEGLYRERKRECLYTQIYIKGGGYAEMERCIAKRSGMHRERDKQRKNEIKAWETNERVTWRDRAGISPALAALRGEKPTSQAHNINRTINNA